MISKLPLKNTAQQNGTNIHKSFTHPSTPQKHTYMNYPPRKQNLIPLFVLGKLNMQDKVVVTVTVKRHQGLISVFAVVEADEGKTFALVGFFVPGDELYTTTN
jgi:hypothetical protein